MALVWISMVVFDGSSRHVPAALSRTGVKAGSVIGTTSNDPSIAGLKVRLYK